MGDGIALLAVRVMDAADLGRIVRERLEMWGTRAIEAHSTPVVMVTVGHDEQKGNLGIHTCEEGGAPGELKLSNVHVAGFLRWAVAQLDPVDDEWAYQTLQIVLDHLRTHAQAGCQSCAKWLRGNGASV